MRQEKVWVAVSSEPQRARLHLPQQLRRWQWHLRGETEPHFVIFQ